ncbi:hypothetical protein TPHA_0D02420 [Tetrapisispora phaffii CBS 4417]|uniref:GOLD domain-containing protein n=1 Tax=Tetrapisispora phaffii (strain ATCC 24235 / CBS 4417 / NBRC 1672 / NRRL Y-8282 / UCD 70-5) TaxID=1071381 RepID=G8BSQ8_TETPH|nr:hypothetical protein TPHA_0D02420 [Tetrapisispora phaffii CBS 4417]CCE62879.1 hypothetical protein TPHA_0D02420 [Tetrapisispora phaffii CBS 4417]
MKNSIFNLCFALFLVLAKVSQALLFDLPAELNPEPFCIRDFVSEGQLVVIEVTSDGSSGDNQEVTLTVRDTNGNEYRRVKDLVGDARVVFTASMSTTFDVCLTNKAKVSGRSLSRSIEVDVESGSEARDWNKVSSSEKLKPIELDLRKIEELADDIVDEFSYMKNREARLRDTNESTNARVVNFSFLIIIALMGLGSLQVYYLRDFFRAKHII